ncbi:hypothetical protein C8R44DRAFT_734251 [Mycena epipterygia]|nr:hypothetical protein C8R44DRAFT_734251 [Mycena epipterygia]
MLRTATHLARPRHALVVRSRPSSSAAHGHDDHHHHEQDDTVYPKEGFSGPIWRKTLVCTIGAALFYEYLGAPADNDMPWLITPHATKSESWLDIASTRAAKEAVLLQGRQLVRSAERPPIYRSRNPEDFNHVSPYGNPVGMGVAWSKPREMSPEEKLDAKLKLQSKSN